MKLINKIIDRSVDKNFPKYYNKAVDELGGTEYSTNEYKIKVGSKIKEIKTRKVSEIRGFLIGFVSGIIASILGSFLLDFIKNLQCFTSY